MYVNTDNNRKLYNYNFNYCYIQFRSLFSFFFIFFNQFYALNKMNLSPQYKYIDIYVYLSMREMVE